MREVPGKGTSGEVAREKEVEGVSSLSTAGNDMTSSERPSPELLLRKEASLRGKQWIHHTGGAVAMVGLPTEKEGFSGTQGGPGSVKVRLRFVCGTVRAVPVFGFGGSSGEGFSCVSIQIIREGRFRFRFLENGSDGSGSDFGL